ncbi:MAG: hypothetical protein ACP5QO_14265 [Clostridia bacterium]
MRSVKIAAWMVGILVVLGGVYQREAPVLWGAVHHYEAAQARKNDTCGLHHNQPCLNPNVDNTETAYAAATSGPPFATAAANAMLRALSVQVIQARLLPPQYAQLGPDSFLPQFTTEFVDVELRVTNRSNRAIHMSANAYTEAGCSSYLQAGGSWTGPETLLPMSDSLYSMKASVLASVDQPNGLANAPVVYLSLAPHQTKTGWISAIYVTNCGSAPNEVLFTDSWPSTPNFGGVTITRPFKPVGPPLPIPASLP